jgi:hypothetical protein
MSKCEKKKFTETQMVKAIQERSSPLLLTNGKKKYDGLEVTELLDQKKQRIS